MIVLVDRSCRGEGQGPDEPLSGKRQHSNAVKEWWDAIKELEQARIWQTAVQFALMTQSLISPQINRCQVYIHLQSRGDAKSNPLGNTVVTEAQGD